jgi:hypothetical protein
MIGLFQERDDDPLFCRKQATSWVLGDRIYFAGEEYGNGSTPSAERSGRLTWPPVACGRYPTSSLAPSGSLEVG